MIPLYATLSPNRVECPRCSYIIEWGKGLRSGRGPKDPRAYDPLTSQLQCPGCQAKYVIGVLVWDAAPWQNSRPGDQRIGPKQAKQLRGQAGGYWAEGEGKRNRKGGANRYLGEGVQCMCRAHPWVRGCPVHDPEEERKAEEEEEKDDGA